MLFIKAFTSYFHIHRPPTPPTVPSPHRPPSSSVCANGAIHRHRRKTAEERFHTLARGWLAYPVTPIHSLLPPKSGCRNVIPRFALSRRRATALFRNPVRKAQRSVPGFSSTTTSACRRYATSPPIVRHHHLIAPTAQYTAIGENRRRAVLYVSTGLARLPRDANPRTSTAEERLYNRHPIGLPRPVTPCAIRRERSLRFPEAPLFALINYCFLTA